MQNVLSTQQPWTKHRRIFLCIAFVFFLLVFFLLLAVSDAYKATRILHVYIIYSCYYGSVKFGVFLEHFVENKRIITCVTHKRVTHAFCYTFHAGLMRLYCTKKLKKLKVFCFERKRVIKVKIYKTFYSSQEGQETKKTVHKILLTVLI